MRAKGLNIKQDRVFFESLGEGTGIDYFEKHLSIFEDFRYRLYKKKYWMYSFFTNIENIKQNIFKATDIKFKNPVSYLLLTDVNNSIKKIQSLPKKLMVLWLEKLTNPRLKIQENVIPKSIITIMIRMGINPFQKSDLSQHTKLKVFIADDTDSVLIPKFPKSISVISMSYNPHLFSSGLIFKLSDYPNLKYVNFEGSIDPKKVPKEWKDAKKAKKLEILW